MLPDYIYRPGSLYLAVPPEPTVDQVAVGTLLTAAKV